MDRALEERWNKIKEKANRLLLNNLKQGENYRYICPDLNRYPHQWFWDSCFHIIVNSHLNIDLAKKELESLLKRQDNTGFIPHMYYWEKKRFSPIDRVVQRYYKNKKTSSLVQPPIIAQAVEAIYKKQKDKSFLNEVLPKISLYYDFLHETRIFGSNKLISIIHTWESGIDNSPIFDKALNLQGKALSIKWARSLLKQLKVLSQCEWNLECIEKGDFFIYRDILFNCVYVEACFILSNLYKELKDDKNSNKYMDRAKMLKKEIIENFWDPEKGCFFGIYGKNNKRDDVKSAMTFLPLLLEDLPNNISHTLVEEHLLEEKEFWTKFPVPSVAIDEPSYSERGLLLWRGPTWININWMIIKGLKKHGFENIAIDLAIKTLDLIEKSGFREFYNPRTGEGMGASHFAWSSLIVDIKTVVYDNTDLDFIFDQDWKHIKKGGFG